MAAEAKRTEGGNVSAAAYAQYGNQYGRFPIFDKQSALAALKLRGRARSKQERANIIERARKWAADEAKAAYATDKADGKI